jgi:hypothetical protein
MGYSQNYVATKPPTRGIRVVVDELRQGFMMRGPSLSSEWPQNSREWYFHGSRSDGFARLPEGTAARLAKIVVPGSRIRENSGRSVNRRNRRGDHLS